MSFSLSILDRYIVKELIGPFLFGVIAFSFILAGSTVLFPLIGDAAKYGMTKVHLIQLFIYKFPNILAFTFPMCMLLASIMAFGRLNNDLEIIAFRAGGIGFYRLVIPVIIAGFLISILTIAFNEGVVPKASQSAENLFQSYRHKTDPTIKQNINVTEYEEGIPSRIINVREIEEGVLKQITVAEFDQGNLTRIIRSDTGRWLSEGGWEFYDGIMHSFPAKDTKRLFVIEFEKESIDIKINPFDFTKRSKAFEEMTAIELKKEIILKKQTGQEYIKDLMNYYLKFSVPFACLIFSILGASVGLRPHRSSSAIGLGLSLMIILGYYILLSVGMGLGLAHTISPMLAAWIPNIVVGAAGLYLLKRLARQ